MVCSLLDVADFRWEFGGDTVVDANKYLDRGDEANF